MLAQLRILGTAATLQCSSGLTPGSARPRAQCARCLCGGIWKLMYVGEVPLNDLGQKLDKPASSAEDIKAAGLDWEVTKTPLYMKHRSE